MALLSISEPGQSRVNRKSKKRLGLGIDLGTTNSLVACAQNGKTKTLADARGRHLLPSVVHYRSQGEPETGFDALEAGADDPSNTIFSVKRLMGRGLADIKYTLPYDLVDGESGGMPLIRTVTGNVSPVEVSAEILKTLSRRGVDALEAEPDGVVITVPAYFDEAQRQATKDAARVAGLQVLRLLAEPTAAAVAYGLDNKLEGTVVIYDLGGGTFDVSLMRLEKGVFQVLATGGDTALGGDDLDREIIAWIQQQAGLDDALDSSRLSRITHLAKQAKHTLSSQDSCELSFEGWKGTLDRITLDTLIDPLIDRTLRACRRVLRDGGVSNEEITDVVMVGGSTRSPRVKQKVSDFFGKELLDEIDPDLVVAIGAAIQADVLVGNKYGDDIVLLDVIPLSLGIETMGGLMEKIIPRNTTIPVSRAQEFTTFKDGQTAMNLHVLQGERELISDCRSLARFELEDIPPMVAGAAKVRVTFQVDADGLMEVMAEELGSAVKSSIMVKPSFGLEEKDIERMIKSSYESAEKDKQVRVLREKQVEAQRIVDAIESALKEDGKVLLDEDEFNKLSEAVNRLKENVGADDAQLIAEETEKLNELSLEFASRRMDSGIKKALAGHSLEEIDK